MLIGAITLVEVTNVTTEVTTTAAPPTTSVKTTKAPVPKTTSTKKPSAKPTAAKTTGGALKTTKAPKPTPPALNCSASDSCSACSKNYHCYWCGPTAKCSEYPSGRIIPKGCAKNDWYWKQCVIPGYVLIIIIPVVAGLFLLCLGCCIYCKCCRSSNKSWKREEERITARRQERQMKAEERKSERKKTTDALRMKYGLLKSDDEEQLIS